MTSQWCSLVGLFCIGRPEFCSKVALTQSRGLCKDWHGLFNKHEPLLSLVSEENLCHCCADCVWRDLKPYDG
eukprot:4526983-Amphidinium_carterae.4